MLLCVSNLKVAILTIFEPFHGLVNWSTRHATITTLISGPHTSRGRSPGSTTQPVPALTPRGLISKPAWSAFSHKWSHTLLALRQLPRPSGVTHCSPCVSFLASVESHTARPVSASFSQCTVLKFTRVAACVVMSSLFED